MHLSSDGSLSRSNGQVVQVAWAAGQTNHEGKDTKGGEVEQETSSLASFNSSNSSEVLPRKSQHHIWNEVGEHYRMDVEMVYSLLSMLGTHDKDDMSRTLLAMSSSQDSCISMRESGCLPLLIQLLHGPERDFLLGEPREGQEARSRASTALHNIVHSHPKEAKRKQESRILRLLEQIRAYCDDLMERNGMGLRWSQAIAELLQIDFELNSDSNDQYVITLRRYSGMALTNLTFGDVTNKALVQHERMHEAL
ncbi:putative adenomatous polyposis coli protein [Apostichopus japonicus]|uniref:Putative adenomatous polyposis coli protein n=1 Tax=Stichopus japonicus TaxID=307972 RepID=A0A2G8LCA7_STIJA|nr:putative adenomatous polyposis coli protein [Apostichopus japonicus]